MAAREYDSSQIEVLEGLEAVRRRPGMYIGDVHNGNGLRQLAHELIFNCLDQFYAGALSTISVRVDGSMLTVEDDGPGISTGANGDGHSFLTRAFTEMHSTATKDGHAPHFHPSGRGSLGLWMVSALCERIEVVTQNSEGRFRQGFARGYQTSPVEVLEATGATGTSIALNPDPEIFTRLRWDELGIKVDLHQLAALCEGLVTSFRSNEGEATVFGPCDAGSLLTGRKGDQHPPCVVAEVQGTMQLNLAWGFTLSGGRDAWSFCNLARPTSGTHVQGFWQGARKALNTVLEHELDDGEFAQLTRGLEVVVSLTMVDPQYGAPTRDRLQSLEARSFVRQTTAREFEAYLRGRPELIAHFRSALVQGPKFADTVIEGEGFKLRLEESFAQHFSHAFARVELPSGQRYLAMLTTPCAIADAFRSDTVFHMALRGLVIVRRIDEGCIVGVFNQLVHRGDLERVLVRV